MSEKANPVFVGGFALGGLIIAITGLLVLGGGKIFEKKITCVAYFDESLSGLDIGAPVEFKGVRVGTVTSVKLIINSEEHVIVRPVTFVLEPSRVSFKEGNERSFSYEGVDRSIAEGLRAQLASQSMLTGKLKIELSINPEQEAVFKEKDDSIHEIPTMLSPLASIKEKFGGLQLGDIFLNIKEITAGLAVIMKDEEVKILPAEINKAMRDLQAVMLSLDKNISVVAGNVNKLLGDVDGKIGSVSENLASMATSARQSMKNANKLMLDFVTSMTPLMKETTVAVGRISGALDERSTLRIELEELLDSLSKAARSFDELTSYIEQHPESLLRGKE